MTERWMVMVGWALLLSIPLALGILLVLRVQLHVTRSAAASRYRLAMIAFTATALSTVGIAVRLLRGVELSAAQSIAAPDPLATVATQGMRVTGLVFVAWVIGVTVSAAVLTIQWLRVRRLRTHDTTETGREVSDLVRVAAASMRVDAPRVLFSTRVSVPAVVGVRQPILLLPIDIQRSITREQLILIIAHELAHVRRADPLVNIVQSVVQCVFFFNPAVHLMATTARAEREVACDELAARTFGSPLILARALERLETMRADRPRKLVMAADTEPLLRRILALAATPPTPQAVAQGPHAAVLPAAAILSLSALCVAAVPSHTLDSALRETVPAGNIAQHINAIDDGGPFTISVVNYRAVAATFDGRPFPAERIRQRGNVVRFTGDNGHDLLTVTLRPAGGMSWRSR